MKRMHCKVCDKIKFIDMDNIIGFLCKDCNEEEERDYIWVQFCGKNNVDRRILK